MFKNRWGALFFVCLTAYGAASLIGGEDDEGVLLTATDELTQSRSEFSDHATELSKARPRPVLDAGPVDEFSSDDDLMYNFADGEDLIDSASGFDPAPDVNPEFESGRIAEQGDQYMLIDDDELE